MLVHNRGSQPEVRARTPWVRDMQNSVRVRGTPHATLLPDPQAYTYGGVSRSYAKCLVFLRGTVFEKG